MTRPIPYIPTPTKICVSISSGVVSASMTTTILSCSPDTWYALFVRASLSKSPCWCAIIISYIGP